MRKNKLRSISFLLFFLVQLLTVYQVALPQDQPPEIRFSTYTSENLRIEKGLSQNWIYCIMQDREGFMWFGTWDGINRFDGYNFTIYSTEDGMPNHTVFSMVQDKEGMIWIGTENGLSRFNPATKTFRNYLHQPGNNKSLVNNRITRLMIDIEGSLWIGTSNGLSKFNIRDETFTSVLTVPSRISSIRSNWITHLYQASDSIIWVSTTSGLIKLHPRTLNLTRYYKNPIQGYTSLSDNNIRCVLELRGGNLLIGTIHGLNLYSPSTNEFINFYHEPGNPGSISDDYIRDIMCDSKGRIWIATDNGGLDIYHPVTNTFTSFMANQESNFSLSSNKIYCLFEDRHQNLWAGTYKGVNKISPYSNHFLSNQLSAGQQGNPNHNVVWAFYECRNGDLWFATTSGLVQKKANTGKLTYHPLTNQDLLDKPPDCRSIKFSNDESILYIATFGSGFIRYYPATGRLDHFPADPVNQSVSSNYVNDIECTGDGLVWIATGRGLNVYNPATSTFRVYRHSENDMASLSNDIIICLYTDSEGRLWAGTEQGLNMVDTKSGKMKRFFYQDDSGKKDKNITVFSVYESADGKFWIGTSGDGLISWDRKSGKHRRYQIKDGLPDNIIYSIIGDRQDNIWVSTNQGIAKFDARRKLFVNYDVRDGLQSNEYNLGASFMDKSGRIYFGGVNGYNTFYSQEIKINPIIADVVLTRFKIFGREQPVIPGNNDTIVLKYNQNFFSFEFSALDFTNPAKNKYKYRLTRFDKDWSYTGAENRLAEFTNVNPGRYIFEVYGSNSDGIWNKKGLRVVVIIKPPWWGTWFFRIFALLLLLFVFWTIIFSRFRKIKSKHESEKVLLESEKKILEAEKQILELEQKALRLQMNPHFIFNSLNSVQSYIISHDIKKAVNYLGKFAQLMRLILSNSQEKSIPLAEELKAVQYYLDIEQLRFEDKFAWSLEIDPAIDTEYIEVPPLIFQPYIENSIIHGLLHKENGGNIWIRVNMKNDRLYCTIEDDGIGREKSRQLSKNSGLKKKSTGLIITQKRLEYLTDNTGEGYTVKITDLRNDMDEPSGTRVDITFPVVSIK